MTAEENCDPDEDGCGVDMLCDIRCVPPLINRPGFIQQHEVENIDGTQDDRHHFEEEEESRVLLGSRHKEHHPCCEVDREAQNSERQQLVECGKRKAVLPDAQHSEVDDQYDTE